jgi:hypothetical protein
MLAGVEVAKKVHLLLDPGISAKRTMEDPRVERA